MNGIGLYAGGIKDQQIKQMIHEEEPDHLCLNELNVNFRKLDWRHSLYERAQKWDRSVNRVCAYNLQFQTDKAHLYGGLPR